MPCNMLRGCYFNIVYCMICNSSLCLTSKLHQTVWMQRYLFIQRRVWIEILHLIIYYHYHHIIVVSNSIIINFIIIIIIMVVVIIIIIIIILSSVLLSPFSLAITIILSLLMYCMRHIYALGVLAKLYRILRRLLQWWPNWSTSVSYAGFICQKTISEI